MVHVQANKAFSVAVHQEGVADAQGAAYALALALHHCGGNVHTIEVVHQVDAQGAHQWYVHGVAYYYGKDQADAQAQADKSARQAEARCAWWLQGYGAAQRALELEMGC